MATEVRYACCLVGGTFDRLHSGHKLLLSMAISRSEQVEIHVVNDEIAGRKSPHIQPYDDRVDAIYDWLSEKSYHSVSIFQLNDSFGPAPNHESADAIIATPETIGNCQEINRMRELSGLGKLSILEVPHMLDYSGKIISSSRIRSGMIDSDGNAWIDDQNRQHELKMVATLDNELKTPMGTLFEGPEEYPEVAMSEAIESIDRQNSSIVAVGDVSVATLIGMGIVPDIGIVDGMTKRVKLNESELIDSSHFTNILSAINPAGHIMPSLIDAVENALSKDEPTIINVEGEEDLAPIIIHCLAPIGTAVIYGQPKTGVVVQISTLTVKNRCRDILSMFEVID
ncbi:MAG: pantetheine-phosphate adenylyltransferase [Candidatus Poseidoniaceae archaeon]